MIKKIISVLFALALVLTVFCCEGASADTSSILYETEFDSNDGHIVKIQGDGTLEFNDGELQLTRAGGTNVNFPDEVSIYAKEDRSGLDDNIVKIDFAVKRSDRKNLSLSFYDEDGKIITVLNFHTVDKISALYRQDIDGKKHENIIAAQSTQGEYTTLSLRLNCTGKFMNISVNGTPCLTGVFFAEDASGFSYMTVGLSSKNYQTVSLDYFKAAAEGASNQDIAAMDYAWLTFDGFCTEPEEEITQSFTLPADGPNGSTIVWQSSDDNVVTSSGEVIRSSEGDKSVTLTASISYSGATIDKTFDLIVKKLSEVSLPSSGEAGYIADDPLTDLKNSKQLYVTSGSPVATTDGLVISAGDKFTYSFDNNKGPFIKPVAFEFTLKQNSGTLIEVCDDSGFACFAVKTENNKLMILSKPDQNSPAEWRVAKQGLFDKKLILVTDPVSGEFYLWYSGDLVVTSSLGARDEVDISKLNKINVSQTEGTATIADLKIYFPNLPTEAVLGFDAAYLTYDRLSWQKNTHITEDLTLKTEGLNGSVITWQSSDADTIDSNGRVTVPSSGSKDVTLTATLSYGGKTKTKDFNFTVYHMNKSEMPEVKKMLIEESFDFNEYGDGNWDDQYIEDGYVQLKNEKMHLVRTGDGAETVTLEYLYFTPSKTQLQGVYCLEFTMEKESGKGVWARVDGSGAYMNFLWRGTNNLEVYWSDTPLAEGANAQRQIIGNYNEKIKVTTLFYTMDSTMCMWINGEKKLDHVYGRTMQNSIQSFRFYMNSTDMMDFRIDDIKFYEAYALSEDRVRLDKDWLQGSMLTDESDTALSFGYVSKDFTLPTKGSRGSNISWTSLPDGIVSPTGHITRTDNYEAVTLIATFSYGEISDTKRFTYTIVPRITDDATSVMRDAESLTYEEIAKLDNGSRQIKSPLNFVHDSLFGSEIRWSSSNTAYIDNSGKITRPRYDEADVDVTVTATIKKGAETLIKTFDFTVMADEPFTDPQYMTDAEFFGVYDGSAWTTKPKLDYSVSGMEPVGEAAKNANGDYTEAKEELLYYFQNTRTDNITLNSSSRNTGWANMRLDGWQNVQSSNFYKGNGYITNDWSSCYINITPPTIASTLVCCSIRAWYNENTYIEVARANDPDPLKRPRLELTVNGIKKVYYALDDALVRAGAYKDTNYATRQYLRLQDYGEFLSDNLWQAALKFDLYDLKSTDVITDTKLVIYARAPLDYAGDKRIIVLDETDTEWNSQTATWNTFTGHVYSFNGQPTDVSWEDVPGAEVEYWFQINRFNAWPAIAAEYMFTGDEAYAYKLQRTWEDYIVDVANRKHKSSVYEDPAGIRGGYPRSLDAAAKLQNVCTTFPVLIKGKYVTPDFCTAVLKNMWDDMLYLTDYHSEPGNNWSQHEFDAMMVTALNFPEYYYSNNGDGLDDEWTEGLYDELDDEWTDGWYSTSVKYLENILFTNTFDDGAYAEACTSYAGNALDSFIEFKIKMMGAGADTSPEYDQRLKDFALYQLLCFAPDGKGVSYGDSGYSDKPRGARSFKYVYDWFNDKEMEYIATFGESGVKPDWTSKSYNDSKVTTMRAGWDKKSPYLFTNVRGGGGHGHADYNLIVLIAYGRTLLSNANYFVYSGLDKEDSYADYGKSTKAHNTVLINDTSQEKVTDNHKSVTGTIYDFSTNSAFDFLSQSTPNNPGFEHRRTITFVKPDLFFVNDLMIPEDKVKVNNYKQVWHMFPESNIGYSETDMTIYSNYESGANIILACADDDAEVKEELGWQARAYAVVEEAPFCYFEKSSMGDTKIDTVIMPNDGDATAALSSSKIDTPANTTGMKINYTKNGVKYEGYFFLSYNGNGGVFGPYETDATTAYVQKSQFGKYSILIKDGSFIKFKGTDSYLFESPVAVSEVYVDLTGTNAYITSATDLDSGVKIIESQGMGKVYINDEAVKYGLEGGYITNLGTGSVGTDNVINTPIKGVVGSEGAGGAGGGGAGGGGTAPGGEVTPPPAGSSFPDTDGHWADTYIADLKSKGIVQGDANGNFNPDNDITRAEFITMAVKSLGLGEAAYKGCYSDVNSLDWYAGIIQMAYENGIISPDTAFRPNDPITREEMAKIISLIAKLGELYPEADTLYTLYADAESISEWAREYVGYVTGSGLMNGKDGGRFDPAGNATRGEAAAVISRMLNMK